MKENELQLFMNEEFGNVRTTIFKDKVYFIATDIATALGYKKPNNAINTHCKSTLKQGIATSQGNISEMLIIPEGDVYRLIMKSKLPSAEKFESWVMDEILPTIHKHGIYATPNKLKEMLNEPDSIINILQMLKEEQERSILLKQENEKLTPDAEMANELMKRNGLLTLKQVADNIEIGRTKLCALLREKKILSKQTGFNEPIGKYIKSSYFKTIVEENERTNHISVVTLVTPKGLKFIYRLIKKNDLLDEFDTSLFLEVQPNA